MFTEVSEEAHLARETHLADGFDRIKRVAKVLPCRELAELDSEKKNVLVRILGRHGAQAVLLARKPGRALWTDDFMQASCALQEYGVRSIWSELVAMHLQSRGMIEPKAAADFVATLVGFRYQSIMITPATFLACGAKAGWNANVTPLKQALEPLRQGGPTESVLGLAIGVASEVERQIEDHTLRTEVASLVVRAILSRSDGLQAVGWLRHLLRNREEWVGYIESVVAEQYKDTDWSESE